MKNTFKRIENKIRIFRAIKPSFLFTIIFFFSLPTQLLLSKLNNIIKITQKEFNLNLKETNFTNKWFDYNISLFFFILNLVKIKSIFRKVSLLEFGSWEGRSSLFILSFSKKFFLTCVDTWEGADEHKETKELNDIFNKFQLNLKKFTGKNLLIKRQKTKDFFISNPINNKYDFIYIDASHKASDAFLDLANSINHSKRFSFIVIDHYLRKNYDYFKKNPGYGINLLINSSPNKIIIPIFVSYQVVLFII